MGMEAQNAKQAAGNTRLDTVRVRATKAAHRYATPTVRSATRQAARPVDLPLSLTSIGRGRLDDQSMQSLADVVRYVPGVVMGQGEGHRDQPTLRGIASTADLYVDGVRDDAQYLRDVYNVERVEVLRGPNALAFGRGGGGGVINRVLRTADFTAPRSFTMERGAYDHVRGTVDVGQNVGARASTRLTAAAQSSGTFRGGVVHRAGVNPTAALVTAGGVLRLGFEHFEDRRTVDRGIPSLNGAPAPLSSSTFFGDEATNRTRAVVDQARLEFERSSGATSTWRTVVSWSQYDKMYQNVVPGAMQAAGATLSLSAYRHATDRRNLFAQSDLTWHARTGRVSHALLIGGEVGRQATANFRETGYFGANTSIIVPAHDNAAVPAPTYRQSATDASNATLVQVASAFAQHQGNIGTHWQTTLGVRVERIGIDFENYRATTTLDRVDVLVSPRAALVFKPRASASLYASLATSALPSAGDQFSSLTATTVSLKPEQYASRELGAKWQPSSRLTISGAYYLLVRSRATAPDPLRPGTVIQTGRQESRGVEFEVEGEPVRGWLVTGSATAQRARIASRTTSAAAGATMPLVPARSVSLWNRLQLSSRLMAGVGVVHQSRMYAAVDNAVTLPAFTRVDGALYVPLTTRWMAQLFVENAANMRYIATAHSNNNLQPGAPRTLRVALNLR
ncbi:MAG: TonB-dependent siderophore receptor [Gemmatimonadaceae bacterium]|nr:TonB-dependent siderophore receptor [Gemmatimonadaceae bacterium]